MVLSTKIRKLCENNRRKHQNTSQKFSSTQHLMKDYEAAQRGKYRFQAENQRRHGRIHALLSHNLQCISHSGGHDARVEHRHRCLQDQGKLRVLKQQHPDAAKDLSLIHI